MCIEWPRRIRRLLILPGKLLVKDIIKAAIGLKSLIAVFFMRCGRLGVVDIVAGTGKILIRVNFVRSRAI